MRQLKKKKKKNKQIQIPIEMRTHLRGSCHVRAVFGVVTSRDPKLPRRDCRLLPLCPAALLLLPLHQPAQNRRTGGDAHLDQCMNGARIFIIGSCYQSLSRSYAYLFNSPPLIIRSGPQVRHCRSVAATEEDKKITEHFRTWNTESTDPTKDPKTRFGGA
ncbi:unnamed protein product [Sphagnum compactum]